MHKKVYGKKFNRSGRSRLAMFRGLVRGLAENGYIRTSETKAKALQQEMDKLFQLVRKDSLAARRDLLAKLGNDTDTVDRLVTNYKVLATSRTSGFTTLKWEDQRRGDNTRMALVELIKVEEKKEEVKKESKKTEPKETKEAKNE